MNQHTYRFLPAFLITGGIHPFGRYYCSKACQVSDWPSHKQHHINLSKAAGDATVENLGGDFRSLAASGCSDAGSRIREERDADGATPLILKAAHGDLKGVEELLTAGADPAAVDDQGLSALHYASYLGHVKVVRALIAHTKSSYLIQLAPPNGVNSLLLAAQEGHLSIVEALAKARREFPWFGCGVFFGLRGGCGLA